MQEVNEVVSRPARCFTMCAAHLIALQAMEVSLKEDIERRNHLQAY